MVLKAIKDAKIDAIVGYTQRFRRKWLAGKEKVRSGALGDVTLVTSRAFMNRLVAIDNYKRTDDPTTISPMVISGTHALDMGRDRAPSTRPTAPGFSVALRHGNETLGALVFWAEDGTARLGEEAQRLARWCGKTIARGIVYARRLEGPARTDDDVRALLESIPLTPRERDVVGRLVAGASTPTAAGVSFEPFARLTANVSLDLEPRDVLAKISK